MAKKFKKMGMIKDTEGGNFGSYSEHNGGGTPVGGRYGGPSGRVGWKERGEPGHRDEQPRTNDGKFTYNSVNGMETKYDGRGKTVNPLLTGGENGIKIDQVKGEFQTRTGSIYDKYKDKWYQKGSMKATQEGVRALKYKIKLSANDIWEAAKYSINAQTGEFGTSAHGKKAGLAPESTNWDANKPGTPGKAGKEAKDLAQKTHQEQFVRSADQGIARFKDENAASGLAEKLGLKKKSINSNLTHTAAQIQAVRKLLEDGGTDTSAITDEQLDGIVDQYVIFNK